MKKAIDKPNEAKISQSRPFSNFKGKICSIKKSEINKGENERDKILGIDYGASKIGLALADTETRMAFAYDTLSNDKSLLQNLAEIIKKESVRKIIIGIPSYINKKEVVYEGEKLGELIKKALPNVEIEYQNEMFTTKMAQANLIEKKVKGIKKFDDQEAARIILQSWLDKT